jgi:hypothetical protein
VRQAGLLILVGSLMATFITLSLWFGGLVFGLGGALIHLLLVIALTIGPLGFAVGLVLLLVGSRGRAGDAR